MPGCWRQWSYWFAHFTYWIATFISFLSHRERVKARGEGDDKGWDGGTGSSKLPIWIWPNSRRQWKTGGPGVPWSMGSWRVGHDLMTKQLQQVYRITLFYAKFLRYCVQTAIPQTISTHCLINDNTEVGKFPLLLPTMHDSYHIQTHTHCWNCEINLRKCSFHLEIIMNCELKQRSVLSMLVLQLPPWESAEPAL